MSSVIRTTTTIDNVVNGSRSFGSIPQQIESVTTYSDKLHQTVQVVGTAEEVISSGDVPSDAMCVVRNMHATAVVSIGVVVSAVFYPLAKIPAGETAKLPRLEAISGTYLKSSVSSTPVLVTLFEIDPTE